jgi:hypothetical protein
LLLCAFKAILPAPETATGGRKQQVQTTAIEELVGFFGGLRTANRGIGQCHGFDSKQVKWKMPPISEMDAPKYAPTRTWLPRYRFGRKNTKAADFSAAYHLFLDVFGWQYI